MPTFRIDLEYDGADFHGWQVQPSVRTVQGTLMAALQRLLRAPVKITGAGRTDAGVHALGQVASFSHETDLEPQKLERKLQRMLPADLRILHVTRAAPGFSARHDAIARRYRYQMTRRPSALWRRFYYTLPPRVQLEAMQEATEVLLGEQDFTAFAATKAVDNPRCLVSRASLEVQDDNVYFEIVANRFLHNMVRRVTGALLEVGRGRYRTSDLRDILQTRDRKRGGPCLPPHALFLVEVRYARQVQPAADVDAAAVTS